MKDELCVKYIHYQFVQVHYTHAHAHVGMRSLQHDVQVCSIAMPFYSSCGNRDDRCPKITTIRGARVLYCGVCVCGVCVECDGGVPFELTAVLALGGS